MFKVEDQSGLQNNRQWWRIRVRLSIPRIKMLIKCNMIYTLTVKIAYIRIITFKPAAACQSGYWLPQSSPSHQLILWTRCPEKSWLHRGGIGWTPTTSLSPSLYHREIFWIKEKYHQILWSSVPILFQRNYIIFSAIRFTRYRCERTRCWVIWTLMHTIQIKILCNSILVNAYELTHHR